MHDHTHQAISIKYQSLQVTNLFLHISHWREFLDIVFFYKAVNNLVFVDSEALPAARQSTRSTRPPSCNMLLLISLLKWSRTVTYQCPCFIHACSTWIVLPAELCTSHISLASFKCSLFQYYNKVLDVLYDIFFFCTHVYRLYSSEAKPNKYIK